jgi:hypothetical protein
MLFIQKRMRNKLVQMRWEVEVEKSLVVPIIKSKQLVIVVAELSQLV